jgi:hypothetical protein
MDTDGCIVGVVSLLVCLGGGALFAWGLHLKGNLSPIGNGLAVIGLLVFLAGLYGLFNLLRDWRR